MRKNNKIPNLAKKYYRIVFWLSLIAFILIFTKSISRAFTDTLEDFENASSSPAFPTKTVTDPGPSEDKGTYPVNSFEGENSIENIRNFQDFMNGTDLTYSSPSGDKLASFHRSVKDMGDGRFRVTTRIGGESYSLDPLLKTDVVLLLDNSSSMAIPNTEGQTRIEQANDNINRFVSKYLSSDLNSQGNNRVALVTYGSDVFDGRDINLFIQGQGDFHYKTKDYTTAFTTNPEEIINSLPRSVPDPSGYEGNTFTQAGLSYAENLFQGSTADRKILIHITDGVPTRSLEVDDKGEGFILMEDPRMFWFLGFQPEDSLIPESIVGDGRYYQLFSPSSEFGKINWRRIIHGNEGTIENHGDSARSQVRLMRQEGIELHTIGFTMRQDGGVSNPNLIMKDIFHQPGGVALPENDNPEWPSSSYIPTDGVDAFDEAMFQILNDSIDLRDTLQGSAFEDSIRGPVTASSDPSISLAFYQEKNGEMVSHTLQNKPIVSLTDNVLKVDNIHLGKDEYIEVSYDVILNTEMEGYEANYFYPTGISTFFPRPEESVEWSIPSPSIRDESLNIDVAKDWKHIHEKDPDYLSIYGDLEKPEVHLKLLRNGKLAREAVLNGANNFQTTFTDLPKYNQEAGLNVYTIEEVSMPSFMAEISYSQNGEPVNGISGQSGQAKIVNTRVEALVQFEKTDLASGNPLEGAVFELYPEGALLGTSSPIKTVTSDGEGLVDLGILGIGNYFLYERKAPDGYQRDTVQTPLKIRSDGNYEIAGSVPGVEGFVYTNSTDMLEHVGLGQYGRPVMDKEVRYDTTDTDELDAITGATIRISDDRDNQINGAETRAIDAEGRYFGLFSGLTEGTYYINTLSPASGYEFDQTRFKVEITSVIEAGIRINRVEEIYAIHIGQPDLLIYKYSESDVGLVYNSNYLETREMVDPEDPQSTHSVLTVKNLFEPNQFHVTKYGESEDTLLTGGTFGLYEEDPLGSPYPIINKATGQEEIIYLRKASDYNAYDPNFPNEAVFVKEDSADQGKIAFFRLPRPSTVHSGIYYLVEEEAPLGYIKSEHVYGPINVGPDNAVLYSGQGTGEGTTESPLAIYNKEALQVELRKVWAKDENGFEVRPETPVDVNFVLKRKTEDSEYEAFDSGKISSDADEQALTWFVDRADESGEVYTYTVEELPLEGFQSTEAAKEIDPDNPNTEIFTITNFKDPMLRFLVRDPKSGSPLPAVIITLVDENNIVFAVATSNEAGEAVFHKSPEREPIKDGAYFIQYLAPTGYSSQLTSAGPILMNTGEGSTEGYQVSGQSILEGMESQKNTFLIQPIRTGPSLAINARDLDNNILLTEGQVSLVLRDEEGREISTFDIDLSDSHIQFEDGSSAVYLNLPGSIQNDTTIEYLQNGIYQLYVNKGPFGYRPVSQEIPLEINFNVRTDPETGIDDPDYLSVKNSPSGQGEALFYTKNDIAIMPLTIDFQKITYPMTGGVGSILFALIGGGIMWIAIKKKNTKMFIEDQNGKKV